MLLEIAKATSHPCSVGERAGERDGGDHDGGDGDGGTFAHAFDS